MTKKKLGKFTDWLSVNEVSFSKRAGKKLRKADWANKMLTETKISTALAINKNENINYEEYNSIKSALFEIRFAYALQQKKLNVEYEAETGVGKSTVDFKINYNDSIWLIELTSIRESDIVKDATITDNYGFSSYISLTTNSTIKSPEVIELIKLQDVICNKTQKEENPHKFPEALDNTYHVIVIDARSTNAGISDYYDYHIATYGSHSLAKIKGGVYCRGLIDQNTGKMNHFKGVFEQNHPNLNFKIIRERIHCICFVKEEYYQENELINKMHIFPNPNLVPQYEKLSKICPFSKKSL